GGVAAGVRRIEAITGENVLAYLRDTEKKLSSAAFVLKTRPDELGDKVQQLVDRNKALEKEVAALKQKLATGAGGGGNLEAQAKDVKGVKLLAAAVDGLDGAGLRTL